MFSETYDTCFKYAIISQVYIAVYKIFLKSWFYISHVLMTVAFRVADALKWLLDDPRRLALDHLILGGSFIEVRTMW